MLIPFLLRQHRTWKNTKLRIFTVAQLEDNSIQMKKDLAAWVYALRIDAEVDVVELQETDLSGYAYERTLRMEQRSEIMKHLKAESSDSGSGDAAVASGILSPGDVTPAYPSHCGRRMSRTSIAIEQLLRETKGIKEAREALAATAATVATATASAPLSDVVATTVKYTTATAAASAAAAAAARKSSTGSASSGGSGSEGEASSIKGSKGVIPVATVEIQAATPEPSPPKASGSSRPRSSPTAFAANLLTLKPDEANVRRMHTAVRLNQVIHDRSHAAKLVVLNLPGLPKAATSETEHHYMEFIEALTEGLDRVLLVRGAGREVITIFS